MANAFSQIGNKALVVASLVIGAVVGMALLAALVPTFAENVAAVSENLSTQTWGDSTADSIAPTLAMVVSLGGLFAIVGLIFVSYVLSKK